MISSRLAPLLLLPLLAACAAAPTTPESSNSVRPDNTPPDTEHAEQVVQPAKPNFQVPEAPASCQVHARKPSPSCDKDVRVQLASALEKPEAERDAALARVEGCAGLPLGLITALRAEVSAPRECGDVVVAPMLAASDKLTLETRDLLQAYALGAQLSRLVADPPSLTAPYDKQHFQSFLKESMAPWIAQQAKAIYELALQGSKLSGVPKALVAVEAGIADMRFVEVVRGVELPKEMSDQSDVRDAYYSTLDDALEPRKSRGRDAALVGLRGYAELGALHDPHVERARELLSKLYGGRRIDALDGLLLPESKLVEPRTTEERLAARLPAHFSALLLTKIDPSEPGILAQLSRHGLARSFRDKLEKQTLKTEPRQIYARVLFDLGRTYWRAADFKRAGELAQAPAGQKNTPEGELVGALASALQAGPKDALDMMAHGPLLPRGVREVSELDTIAKGKGPLSGMGSYDAGFLLMLAPPVEGDPAYFMAAAERFERAARQLKAPAQLKAARERAKAARDTAAAVKKAKANPLNTKR